MSRDEQADGCFNSSYAGFWYMYEYVEFVRVVFILLERMRMEAVEATWNLHACIKTNKNRT